MIQITETIQFNDSEPLLSKQSQEFSQWYHENFHSKILEPLNPISHDDLGRPNKFENKFDGWKCTTEFIFIHKDISNWACSDFGITIEKGVSNE